jgi:hypothetical protein
MKASLSRPVPAGTMPEQLAVSACFRSNSAHFSKHIAQEHCV